MLAGALTTAAMASSGETAGPRLELVVDGLVEPVDVVVDPVARRLLVVEKGGLVRAVDGGGLDPTPVLDLRDRVSTTSELGLLGLAVDPAGARYYASFTDHDRVSVVARYERRADGTADAASETTLLRVDQPTGNHNAGHLALGVDGMLYASFGDGGDVAAAANAQDATNLLGTIVRIDPRDLDGSDGLPYDVPPDNPFVDDPAVRSEIWAFGFRNPWRFEIDDAGGIIVADVGQHAFEEIDHLAPGSGGANHGWPLTEGTRCVVGECPRGLAGPVLSYGRDLGRAVVGGHVVTTPGAPLAERYVFADFMAGWIRAADTTTWTHDHVLETDLPIVAVSAGLDGEALVVDLGGAIHRLIDDGWTPRTLLRRTAHPPTSPTGR